MKFGTVAIIGRSNVGKSTLLNRLLGEKISIVSSKPQTTRTRVMGIVHTKGAQIAFLDTPGLHKPEHLLNRRMVRAAVETLEDADVLYMLMEATSLPGPGDLSAIKYMKEALAKQPRPVILVVTKIDLVNKHKMLPVLDQYAKLFAWTDVVPVSAQADDNVGRLLAVTVPYLPSGEGPYGEDVVTDQTMRTLAAEMIREKVIQATEDEVPYATAVEIDDFIEQGKLAKIRASIMVERETQKGILIGKQGERLKMIGTQARLDMEKVFGMKVFLELWVKVRKDWREDEQALVQLGY
ncbi:MAG: GTPase Era [Nitrospira sp. HN-bin3]|jgi:GTP-binding protein Era|uniref:GTPase Era n=1 Tax=Nitrospira cf. moscoviensis SBR1015 TaxID=96242 RepID=UPI000A0D1F93|nr:GTPase Era [Nitrospira cf. moscoviensis SBR1015]OQW41494.1 MAG: GTPase Era [Nitrospira sp. HN-bin3]